MMRNSVKLTRRGLLAGLMAGAAGPALALAPSRSPHPPARPAGRIVEALAEAMQAPSPPQAPGAPLATLLERARLGGETALIALDAETGAVIEEHRADLRLPPASVAKALTALYAIQNLGPEHRFVTRLEARGGTIEGGVLRGDLVLRGGGDPVLQTDQLAALAAQLVQRGLRRVEGRFLVDASAFPEVPQIDPAQPVAAGYNPAVGGLNLNFNRVHFGWEMAQGRPRVTLDARSDREVPPVSVIGIEAVARNLPVYTYAQQDGRERWTVAASALTSPGSRWLPVRRAAPYAADVFRALLAARGCQVPPPVFARVEPGAVLAEHRSAPLTGLLREMLRYSTNITAEAVGIAASQRLGGAVGGLDPSARRMNAWLGTRYGAQGLELVDHSGLSEASRVSVRGLGQYLLAARREGILPDLLREHPMRDAAGGARSTIEVRAKTGTLNFVSSLAGYAQPRGGRAMVFAIVSADLALRRSISEDESERPPGARNWAGRARTLQQDLIERWAVLRR